jgi:ubiquinone/menaquinone biosynthesis C-methylase UbiE
MSTFKESLSHVSGGKVLDVATGNGQFINLLLEYLKDYVEITGVDTSEKSASVFADTFKDKPKIRCLKMDARHLDFPNESFDTVCISNSLHHMPDLESVLTEMKRVLHSGGYFIVAEMYCDNQTETQMTHVLLHHWWADVDMAKGIVHNKTYARQQILEIVGKLELTELIINDIGDLSDDSKNIETIQYLIDIIDQYLKRIEGLPRESALRERGMELRQRVEEIGFHSATSLLVIGRKL